MVDIRNFDLGMFVFQKGTLPFSGHGKG